MRIKIIVILIIAFFISGYFFTKQITLQQPIESVTNKNHYSYFTQKDFYEQAYASVAASFNTTTGEEPLVRPPIGGIIVNHHLLAANFIAEGFNKIATTAPVTVVLISPNHFNAGKGNIIGSMENWQTPYGILQPDRSMLRQLMLHDEVSIDEDPFNQEHGISGIVAFIKKSLPNARVVPLIFNNAMSSEKTIVAADSMFANLPPNTIVIGSFDFSHYLTNQAADFHDIKNLAAVTGFDYSSLYHLDIDSPSGLTFFLRLMQNFGDQKFTLLEHSNSAKLTHQDILESTSYINGYFTHGQPVTQDVKTILVLPPIEGSPQVATTLVRTNKVWAVEYLERLFMGQDTVIISDINHDRFTQEQLGKYRIFYNLGDAASTHFLSGRIKSEYDILQSPSDGLEFKNGVLTIRFKNPLLSTSVLESGGTSVGYGLADVDGTITVTILPIGVTNGVAKLLIGQERAKILAELAKNSSVPLEIKSQILTGIVHF